MKETIVLNKKCPPNLALWVACSKLSNIDSGCWPIQRPAKDLSGVYIEAPRYSTIGYRFTLMDMQPLRAVLSPSIVTLTLHPYSAKPSLNLAESNTDCWWFLRLFA